MAQADVSVIIPAWRAVDTICRALKSVAAQTYPPREVVVVDDGSGDGTFEATEACRPFMGDISLLVISQTNQGAGAARNRALAEASSTYVAFLDADDEWLPEKIARSLEHIEGTKRVLVSHDFVACSDQGEAPIDCARHFQAAHDPFITLFHKAYVATTTVVARRDAVLAIGGFDASLPAAQDYDLWLGMLGQSGAEFCVFPGALTRYHYSPTGITSHVERRRQCSLRVLYKRAALLRHRVSIPTIPVWVRVLVIHYEAAVAHWTRGQRLAAILALTKGIPELLTASWAPWYGGQKKENRTALLLGLGWIGIILAAYLWQFRSLAASFLAYVKP